MSSWRARGPLGRGAVLATLVFLASCGCGGGEPASSADAAKDWTKDDRIVGLIEECATLGTFSGDTSDLLPVLVSKLERGSMDVMHNVREELAREGSAAIPELDRLVRRLYTEPHGSHPIGNALTVLEMSDAGGDPLSIALLRDCLGHPQETVQSAAIKALARHATPELYDDLESLVRVANEVTRTALITALHQSDPRRFEETLAAWIVADEHAGQWPHAARMVAQTADAETGAHFATMAPGLGDPATRAFLLATLVGQPGSKAAELLGDLLEDPNPQLRGTGLAALEFTELVELAARVLREDEVPTLRAMAVGLLRVHAEEDLARQALRDGLNDSDDTVREASLGALLSVGDEAAADFAIVNLQGTQRDLQLAVRALAGNWDANPGLETRALAVLEERLEEESARPLRERATRYQAIGQIPGPQSTELLLGVASEATGEHQHMSAHRWLLIQASNTGVTGRARLAEAWRTEPDLERRMDIIWAASISHDVQTTDFLKEVLLAERSAPHERLYVAERLAREGPASEVAPLIKRATLRETAKVYRPAMNCLLWRWYGRS